MEGTIRQHRRHDGPPNQVRLAGLVVGKLAQKKRLTDHESRFLTRHAHGDVKMTLPSANQFPAIAYQKGLSERAYPTYSAFLWDVVPIIRSEVQALLRDGVKYIQIDAPRYSYYLDPKWREYLRTEMGVSPEAALDEAIRVDNACVEAARGAAARARAPSSPSTSVAATTGASGTPRAATTRLPRSCSTS